MYYDFNGFQEEEEEYKVSKLKGHIISLVGESATSKLYEKFNTGNSILRAGEEDYRNAGLTDRQISRLIAAKELMMEPEEQIRCSKDAYEHLAFLSNEVVEYFYILVMNRANRVINKVCISQGGTSGTVVDVKVLFQKALSCRTINGIILGHNHPSGNISPSVPDLDVTKKIVEAGKLLDIKVLDHIIIGNNGKYLSFADEGYM